MANTFRYRTGDVKSVRTKAVGSAVVIEIGDLVGTTSDGTVYPASDSNWNGTEETFHDGFLGVALEQSRSGDTDPISVATSGVFEFDTASASYELGDLIGPYDGGAALSDQQVASVATANLAVGRAAKRTSSETTVLVDIQSVRMTGGPQAAA